MNLQESARALVPIACEELLVSIGCSPKKQARPDLAALDGRPRDYAAGVIEFAGEAMTGSLVFLSHFQFFAGCLPVAGRKRPTPHLAADRLRVRDLAMELSNQLLGRIKNQLYRRGVVVEPTLPHAVSGDAIRMVVRERKQSPYVYLVANQQVFVWFEAIEKAGQPTLVETTLVAEGDFVEL
jgi:hypothetical protein